MHSADTLAVASTAGTANSWRTWNSLELFLTVPAGAATVEIGVKHEHATTTATTLADGAIFVDAMEMKPVVGNGVADIDSSHFSEVLTFGPASCRGGGMGNIDGDSKPDIIVGTGTGETVVWMEYVGSDPKDAMSYTTTTILSSKGEPLDRFYPLSISGTDLDGDGQRNVTDIVSLVALILNPGGQPNNLADVNQDGSINVTDIVKLVNLILNP